MKIEYNETDEYNYQYIYVYWVFYSSVQSKRFSEIRLFESFETDEEKVHNF